VLDQVRGAGAHAPAQARRAETTTLAGPGDDPAVAARLADEAREATAEQAAVEVPYVRGAGWRSLLSPSVYERYRRTRETGVWRR
jgi:hypothetical protein